MPLTSTGKSNHPGEVNVGVVLLLTRDCKQIAQSVEVSSNITTNLVTVLMHTCLGLLGCGE